MLPFGILFILLAIFILITVLAKIITGSIGIVLFSINIEFIAIIIWLLKKQIEKLKNILKEKYEYFK